MSGPFPRIRVVPLYLAAGVLLPACIAQLGGDSAPVGEVDALGGEAVTFTVPSQWTSYCTATFDADYALAQGDEVVSIAAGSTFLVNDEPNPASRFLSAMGEDGSWRTLEVPATLLGEAARASCGSASTRQYYGLLADVTIYTQEFGGAELCTLRADTVIPQGLYRCFHAGDDSYCRWDLTVLEQPCAEGVAEGYARAKRNTMLSLQKPRTVLTAVAPGEAWSEACTISHDQDLVGKPASFESLPGNVDDAVVHIPAGTPMLTDGYSYTAVLPDGVLQVNLFDQGGAAIYPEADCGALHDYAMGVFQDLTLYEDTALSIPLCQVTAGTTVTDAFSEPVTCDLTDAEQIRCEVPSRGVSALCPEITDKTGHFGLSRATPFATVALPMGEVFVEVEPEPELPFVLYTAPAQLEGCTATFVSNYEFDRFVAVERIKAGSTFLLTTTGFSSFRTHELMAQAEDGRWVRFDVPNNVPSAPYQLSCEEELTRHFVGTLNEVPVYADSSGERELCRLPAGTTLPQDGKVCSNNGGLLKCELTLDVLEGRCGDAREGYILDTDLSVLPFLGAATLLEARALPGALGDACTETADQEVLTRVAGGFQEPGFVRDAVVRIPAGTPIVATIAGTMAHVGDGLVPVYPGNDAPRVTFTPRCTGATERSVGAFGDAILYSDDNFQTRLCDVTAGRTAPFAAPELAVRCDKSRADEVVCRVAPQAVRGLCPGSRAQAGFLRVTRPTPFASVPAPLGEFNRPAN